jgi:hypothetical protein
MKTMTTPYDVAEHLRTPEDMAFYLGTPEKAKTLVLQRHWAIGRR